jgi:tripartite-type tricarboxylate transporter receptor subunit TctC
MHTASRRTFPLVLSALALLSPSLGLAQAYPAKPVKVIIPYGPGSATDFVSRTLTDELRGLLGQPFVIDYRPGGDGSIGAAAVATAAPDGYTLLVGTNGTHSANPYLFRKLSYDAIKDFTPVSYLVSFTSVVAVNPSLPVSTLPELIAWAKANPGKASYAYGNTIGRVTFSTLFKVGGVNDAIGVPYKSNPLAVTDVIAGVASMTLVDLATSSALLKSGKLKPIAGARLKRSSVMPDVPAISETPGYAGFDIRSWVGLFGPGNLPRPIVNTLNAATVKAMTKPDVQKRFLTVAAELEPGTPEEFQAHVQQQLDIWRQRLRDAGIQPE